MIKLVKQNDIFSGVKNSYEVVYYSISYKDKYIGVAYSKTIINEQGYVETEKFDTALVPKNTTQSPSLMIDPEWNENSTPPKPEGFLLEDPETWGTLMWEEIPFITLTVETPYDKFLAWKTQKPENYLSYDLDEFLLRMLVELKVLPSEEEGWSIAVTS